MVSQSPCPAIRNLVPFGLVLSNLNHIHCDHPFVDHNLLILIDIVYSVYLSILCVLLKSQESFKSDKCISYIHIHTCLHIYVYIYKHQHMFPTFTKVTLNTHRNIAKTRRKHLFVVRGCGLWGILAAEGISEA